MVKEEEKQRREGAGCGEGPRLVVLCREDQEGGQKGDAGGEFGEMTQSEARGGVGGVDGVRGLVLPGVDEEAIEAAEKGEQERGR